MSATRPADSIALQVAELGDLIERQLIAALAPFDLTPAEFRILNVLSECGSCTAADIAMRTPIDPSFISRMVHRLAQKQLIARRRSRSDRRTVTLRATDSGKELLLQLVDPLAKLEHEVLHGLSDAERAATMSLAAAIRVNLESDED